MFAQLRAYHLQLVHFRRKPEKQKRQRDLEITDDVLILSCLCRQIEISFTR